jgi:hypothetical protein
MPGNTEVKFDLFDLIILRYRGLETDAHVIELGTLAQSLQGAARLLGSAGTIVQTGQFAKKSPAMAVRVLTGAPKGGSYEIPVFILGVTPMIAPVLPVIKDFSKTIATKAVTGIVNYAISKVGGHKKESEMAFDLAKTALAEMGHTARHSIDAIERVATSQRPAIKLFVSPIGVSCNTAQVGEQENGAVLVDRTMRNAIEGPEPVEIGESAQYEILLSELDLKNKSCKFSMRDDDEPEQRTNGEITDPILLAPNNPYSAALNGQRWLSVIGKPQLKDGDIERLYISDLVREHV